jgi:uncharacterized membrane protein YobD (UPF0266 family)
VTFSSQKLQIGRFQLIVAILMIIQVGSKYLSTDRIMSQKTVLLNILNVCMAWVSHIRTPKIKFQKKLFYSFITYKALPFCLHTPFPTILPLFVAILEHILWDVI